MCALLDTFEEKTTNVLESIRLEEKAVKAAEAKDYDLAIATFQSAIDIAPGRAAPYNNRAQTYRLIGNDEGIHFILLYFYCKICLHKYYMSDRGLNLC